MTDQPKEPYSPEDDHEGRAVDGEGSQGWPEAGDEPTAQLNPQDPAPEPAGSEVLGADELQHGETRSDPGAQHSQPFYGEASQRQQDEQWYSHETGQPSYGNAPQGQQPPYGQNYGQSPYGDASQGQQYAQPRPGQPYGAAGYGQQYPQAHYGAVPQYGPTPYGQQAWGGSAGHQQYDPSIRPGSAGGDGGPGQPGGFFGALFDFRFNRFVTPTITRAVYALLAVFIVLWYLVIAVAAFDADVAFGVLWLLVIGPITVLVAFAMTRMMLELHLSVVRVGQDVRDIKERESGATRPADGRST